MHDEQNLDTGLVAAGPSVVIATPIYGRGKALLGVLT
jgi:hypothetical protein